MEMYYIDFSGNSVEYTVKEDLKISEKVAFVSEYAESGFDRSRLS